LRRCRTPPSTFSAGSNGSRSPSAAAVSGMTAISPMAPVVLMAFGQYADS
jgi:hypothetical protein